MDYVVIVLEVGCNAVALCKESNGSGMRLDHREDDRREVGLRMSARCR